MARLLLALALSSAISGGSACGQEGVVSAQEELREIRRLLEQQSKQIEALSQQVSQLAGGPDKRKAEGGNAEMSLAPRAIATPLPAMAEIPETSKTAPGSGAPHVVAKGETLTSIAKHYKVTVSDLQKINKIENDRTLQIGQSLTIPLPRTAEPSKNP